MKRKIASTLLAFIFVFNFFSVPAAALQNESQYLSSYRTDALATSDGKIAFEASVRGTRVMDQIGIRKITIYAKIGNFWTLQDTFTSEDEGMVANDTFRYGNTIYYDATPGVYYQIFITIFAEDSTGSDSRTEVHYVTARGSSQT